jgi:hypothetical protein
MSCLPEKTGPPPGARPDWGSSSSRALLKPRQTFRFGEPPVETASTRCTTRDSKPHRAAPGHDLHSAGHPLRSGNPPSWVLRLQWYSETCCRCGKMENKSSDDPWQKPRACSLLHEACISSQPDQGRLSTRRCSRRFRPSVSPGALRWPTPVIGPEKTAVGSRHVAYSSVGALRGCLRPSVAFNCWRQMQEQNFLPLDATWHPVAAAETAARLRGLVVWWRCTLLEAGKCWRC